MVRTLKETAELWKDQDEFCKKAAVKFAWEFKRWEGFGMMDELDSRKLGEQE